METMIPAWIDGKLTPVEKLKAHVKGIRHKAVSVFLIHDGKVLIQQRATEKYHTPNLWANTCCTHPHWGEDPADCAVRRLEDELGITGVAPIWAELLEYRADVGDGLVEHEVVDLFVAHCAEPPALSLNPDEVQATRWISQEGLNNEISETPEKFTPWLRIYMESHAKSVFGPT